MKSKIFRQINYEYDKKRDLALIKSEHTKNKIYEEHPDLVALDDKLKFLGLKLSQAYLHSDPQLESKVLDLQSQIEDLQTIKKATYAKYGLSASSFEPQYECPNCLDTGIIFDSKSKLCHCYKQKLVNLAYKQSNLEILESQSFETFDESLFSEEVNVEKFGSKLSPQENILQIRKRCLDFVDDFDNIKRKNLIFVGPHGLGKTFLSSCIAKELISTGKTVIYQTAPRLFDMIKDYKVRFEKPEHFSDNDYNDLFEVDLLIIDDLGAEALNTTTLAEFFTIINTRLLSQSSKNTKTILSTNLSIASFEDSYGTRLSSRVIGEFNVLRFIGDDIRLKLKFRNT